MTYRLTAEDSALVETWAMSAAREALTLYSMDGGELVATHFWPHGNAPRLQWVRSDGDDKLAFEFRDGTNLQPNGKWHQRAYWLRLLGEDAFERSETYVPNGTAVVAFANADEGPPVAYRRLEY